MRLNKLHQERCKNVVFSITYFIFIIKYRGGAIFSRRLGYRNDFTMSQDLTFFCDEVDKLAAKKKRDYACFNFKKPSTFCWLRVFIIAGKLSRNILP